MCRSPPLCMSPLSNVAFRKALVRLSVMTHLLGQGAVKSELMTSRRWQRAVAPWSWSSCLSGMSHGSGSRVCFRNPPHGQSAPHVDPAGERAPRQEPREREREFLLWRWELVKASEAFRRPTGRDHFGETARNFGSGCEGSICFPKGTRTVGVSKKRG